MTHHFYIAWMGQELLTTFENEIGEFALIPGGVGIFTVKVNNSKLYCLFFG